MIFYKNLISNVIFLSISLVKSIEKGSYDSYNNSDNLKRNYSLGGYDVVSEKKTGFSFRSNPNFYNFCEKSDFSKSKNFPSQFSVTNWLTSI